MAASIEADGLGRNFGEIRAVDGVTFEVRKGEVLGFLGPNGAGKSTTMKLLTCFLSPSFGTARVGGFDIQTQSREVRKLIGYLPENAPLYGDMRVLDFLSFIAEVRGIEGVARKSAVERVVHLTSLQDVLSQQIETLSKGFRRRVGLAQSLVHDPEILILDEPTDGLDPNQKFEVRQLINSMAADKCIILSTHILEEVDAVCNRAIIIAGGKIVADGTPDELRKRGRPSGVITVTFSQELDEAMAVLSATAGVKEVHEAHLYGGRTSYAVVPSGGKVNELLSVLLREIDSRSWTLLDVRVESGQLDEVFRTLTNGTGR